MSQSVIQRLASQWQKGATETAKYSICGCSGRGVDSICFDEVYHDWHKGEYEAEPDKYSAQDRYKPEDLFFSCPTVDKEADRNAGCAGEHRGKAVFGFEAGTICGGKSHSVGKEAVSGDAAHHANAKTEVSEADKGGWKVVSVFKDVCEGCEENVEVAIDKSHIG